MVNILGGASELEAAADAAPADTQRETELGVHDAQETAIGEPRSVD